MQYRFEMQNNGITAVTPVETRKPYVNYILHKTVSMFKCQTQFHLLSEL